MTKFQGISARLKKFFKILGRLQWKLTLAYTLSTVITTIILAAIGLLLLWYINFRSALVPRMIADGLLKGAPVLEPYLEQELPDRSGLQKWLRAVTPSNHLMMDIPNENTEDSADTMPGQFGRVVMVSIVDEAGYVQATTSAEIIAADANAQLLRPSRLGTIVSPADINAPALLLHPHLEPAETVLLNRALQGETDPSLLSIRDDNQNLLAAVPILNQDQQVLGAIFVKLAFPIEQRAYLQSALWQLILPVMLGILVAGGLAGILFGYLIARNLTRRLRLLSTAADAWSQGHFTTVVRDTTGDEVGYLTRHLNQMAVELQTLLQTRQELAMLEERNRLARELHDSVKQQVFATAMQVGAARALVEQNPAAAKISLLEAEQLVSQAQQELTTLIRELRPAALEGQGLTAALSNYVTDWSRQSGIPAEIRASGERPLPLPLEQALFRVAQEALTNVARHSRAGTVEVQLVWEDDTPLLTITDNGQGFSPAGPPGKGLGLQSMRERVEFFGGTLTVQSHPGQGTRIMAQIPKGV